MIVRVTRTRHRGVHAGVFHRNANPCPATGYGSEVEFLHELDAYRAGLRPCFACYPDRKAGYRLKGKK
jgi:methylphosphotriester-DNA--protein-cysteine methyltransferase